MELERFNKVRLGDEEEFSSLFRSYFERLYEFAGRFVKDPQAAEDIVQDVFVKLWVDKSKIKIKHSVKSYLYTAVKNQSINYINKNSRLSSLDDKLNITEDKEISPEEDSIKNELYKAVHEAIDNLPDQCRKVYLMKKYDDLSYNEIAEILGISINTVKTQMKRAMKSLLKQLAYLRTIILIFIIL